MTFLSSVFCSLELLSRNVVHGEVVHVGLDELKGLLLDHAGCTWLKHGAKLLNHVSANALPLLAGLVEGMADNLLDIIEGLDTLAHAEAEVTEPLMVEGDGPVLAEEFHSIGDDVVLVALGQLIQVVFMKAYETPQALQDNLLVAHVRNRIN